MQSEDDEIMVLYKFSRSSNNLSAISAKSHLQSLRNWGVVLAMHRQPSISKQIMSQRNFMSSYIRGNQWTALKQSGSSFGFSKNHQPQAVLWCLFKSKGHT